MLVQDALNDLTEQIKDSILKKELDGYGNIIVGKDPKGRSVKMSDAGNLMNKILNDYSRYVEAINAAQISKERHGEIDKWNENTAKDYAKRIKDSVNKIKDYNYAW
jgi:hypothetical protein